MEVPDENETVNRKHNTELYCIYSCGKQSNLCCATKLYCPQNIYRSGCLYNAFIRFFANIITTLASLGEILSCSRRFA